MSDKPEFCSTELAKYVCWVKRGLNGGFFLESTLHDITTLITFSIHDFHLDTEKYVLPYSVNFWRDSISLSLSLILVADPTVYSSSLPNVQSCTLPWTDNEHLKKKKKVRKGLTGLKETTKNKQEMGWQPPVSWKKTYFASIGNNKYIPAPRCISFHFSCELF